MSTRRDALREALPLVALLLRLAARLSRAVRLCWLCWRAERLPSTRPPRTCSSALSFHALSLSRSARASAYAETKVRFGCSRMSCFALVRLRLRVRVRVRVRARARGRGRGRGRGRVRDRVRVRV